MAKRPRRNDEGRKPFNWGPSSKKTVHPARLELKPDHGDGKRLFEPEIHNQLNEEAKEWVSANIAKLNGEFGEEVRLAGGALPGEFPTWDKNAWGRLIEKVGRCLCNQLTLMPDERGPCPLYEYVLAGHDNENVAAFYSTVMHKTKKF